MILCISVECLILLEVDHWWLLWSHDGEVQLTLIAWYPWLAGLTNHIFNFGSCRSLASSHVPRVSLMVHALLTHYSTILHVLALEIILSLMVPSAEATQDYSSFMQVFIEWISSGVSSSWLGLVGYLCCLRSCGPPIWHSFTILQLLKLRVRWLGYLMEPVVVVVR